MEASREIQESIQKLAGMYGLKFTKIITGKVLSVSVTDRTCSVETVLSKGKLQLDNVNLSAEQNDGFILIPSVDSTVLVAEMADGENYVIAFSDIDKVINCIDSNNKYIFDSNGFIWNGGSLGGMAKTGVLQTKYNVLEAHVNAIKIIVSAILAAGSGSPGTPVTNGTLAAYFSGFNVASITLTTQTEIEDNKIKH